MAASMATIAMSPDQRRAGGGTFIHQLLESEAILAASLPEESGGDEGSGGKQPQR
jgi:hypothetical protein